MRSPAVSRAPKIRSRSLPSCAPAGMMPATERGVLAGRTIRAVFRCSLVDDVRCPASATRPRPPCARPCVWNRHGAVVMTARAPRWRQPHPQAPHPPRYSGRTGQGRRPAAVFVSAPTKPSGGAPCNGPPRRRRPSSMIAHNDSTIGYLRPTSDAEPRSWHPRPERRRDARTAARVTLAPAGGRGLS